MSLHLKRAKRLSMGYDVALRLHQKDREETLTGVIADQYPNLSEDAQADLYAAVYPSFENYPSGITRRIALTAALRNWSLRRIYG